MISDKGPFTVSGSDIVQSMVLESAAIIQNWFSYNKQLLSLNNMYYNVTTPRLALDIPHVVLSFVVSINNKLYLFTDFVICIFIYF